MELINQFFHDHHFPILLILGFIILIGFYLGKSVKFLKLPSIIGFMIFGVILGPSLFNVLNHTLQDQLSFFTEIALGFVALSIGIELKFSHLKKLGIGVLFIILFESFGAFLLVFGGLFLLTHNLALSLIFGSIAPASAPAGTVAIIQEYKAKGSLTKTLYAVVGFDDGLGIIIFGFAAAFARMILVSEGGGGSVDLLSQLWLPMKEIILSFLFGGAFAGIIALLGRKLKSAGDIQILIFGITFLVIGLCSIFHLSLILTNMVIGMIIVNTQRHSLIQKIQDRLPMIMPLLFILFFTLAGSNLHISALPALGLIGVVYILTRTSGLILGSRLGGLAGKVEDKVKKFTGLGILSQAGVAIGLALIVKHEFKGLGKIVSTDNGTSVYAGDEIGAIVITTITATCIFFEIVGPILTKYALTKAGEIEQKK